MYDIIHWTFSISTISSLDTDFSLFWWLCKFIWQTHMHTPKKIQTVLQSNIHVVCFNSCICLTNEYFYFPGILGLVWWKCGVFAAWKIIVVCGEQCQSTAWAHRRCKDLFCHYVWLSRVIDMSPAICWSNKFSHLNPITVRIMLFDICSSIYLLMKMVCCM